jgi:4-amino-4-deoxy-L-arabinose transferase-like glycosyltransferase
MDRFKKIFLSFIKNSQLYCFTLSFIESLLITCLIIGIFGFFDWGVGVSWQQLLSIFYPIILFGLFLLGMKYDWDILLIKKEIRDIYINFYNGAREACCRFKLLMELYWERYWFIRSSPLIFFFLLGLILSINSITLVKTIDFYQNLSFTFLIINLFLSVTSFFIPFLFFAFKNKVSDVKNLFFFSFVLLSVFSVNFFIPGLSKTSSDFIQLFPQSKDFLNIVILISGLLTIWRNRGKITQQRETNNEVSDENNKFKIVCSVILFILIILLGTFLRMYRLGSFDFREDEFQVVGAAAGYLNTGEYYSWDWLKNAPGCLEKNSDCMYTRAWPHTWLIAQSYKIFGISEWSSRLPSVFWGVLMIVISYFAANLFLKNESLSLLMAFIVSVNPFYLSFSRYTRMYALLHPLFLLLFVFIFKLISENNRFFIFGKKINSLIKEHFNFNYLYLIPVIFLLSLNYLIHINSLVILPIILLYVILAFVFIDRRRYFGLSLIGLFFSSIILILYRFTHLLPNFSMHLSFFGRRNYEYLNYVTNFPFPVNIAKILLVLGIFIYFLIKNSKLREKILYLYTTLCFSLFFFIFIANRYSGAGYISHIMPAAVFLLLWIYSLITRLFNSKIRIILYILPAVLAVNSLAFSYGSLYNNENFYGKYSLAYRDIVENFNTQTDVLFGQYLRPFYLRGIGNVMMISMLYDKKYSFVQFLNDLQENNDKTIWVTWETRKTYHLNDDVVEYIKNNFKQIHGSGVDNLNIEIYVLNND